MHLNLVKLAVRLRIRQGIQGRDRRAHAPGQTEGTAAASHPHHPDDSQARQELLDGGSLYWVVKGEIAVREKLLAIEPFRDRDGIGRCRLVMQPKIMAVSPRPMRAFQGWRYLTAKDAPPDLGKNAASAPRCPSNCGASCAISV